MADRSHPLLSPVAIRVTQIGAAILAVVVVIVFLISQTQTASIEYGTEELTPASKGGGPSAEPGRGSGTLPSNAEIDELMSESQIVRLPGAIADFDTESVLAAIERAEAVRRKEDPEEFEPIRVVLAPPGLSEADSERLYELTRDDLRVNGLSVSLGYTVSPSTSAGWESLFTTGDVTDMMLAVLAIAADEPMPADPATSTVQWRSPTDAELQVVLDGIADDGWHAFPGASLDGIPSTMAEAFPDADPLVVALHQQPYGEPVPDYVAALGQHVPDRPIMVMYGYWIDFAGPFDADTIELAAAGYFGPYDQVLTDRVFPQANGLSLYLQRWSAMRFAGVFDRELPFVPPDPLAVAKPALPWVFGGSVLLFVAGSVYTVRRRPDEPDGADSPAVDDRLDTPAELWARVTMLSSLAIEASGLADGDAKAALVRGITRLNAARDALQDDAPIPLVASQVLAAERELGAMADALGRPDYHPSTYRGEPAGRP